MKNLVFYYLALLFLNCNTDNITEEKKANPNPDQKFNNENDQKYAHSWIVDLKWTLSEDQVLTEFSTEWVVPEEPTEKEDQIIFYFPGLHEVAILQPVLQWGKSAIGGGSFWNVASWYVETAFGPYKSTDFVKVKPGDRCKATMFYKGKSGKKY